ncbi:type II secretion system protein GspM [Robiginitomaculum antarcticum]|uniref:type II secretion system protein GspM n=1 Tax=Robiginitomaculum antarcticum TaxID=437507 RepID=UPI00036E757C|nr:type II secretion system protein GspM [Robiginitomaculum antarcticum]
MRLSDIGFLRNRAPRERALVLGALSLGIVFLLFQFILMPYLTYRSETASALQKAKQDFAYVTRMAPQAGGPQTAARRPFTREVLIEQARADDLSISRVQPAANGMVTVWFDDQSAAGVLGFMRKIESSYETDIDQVILSRRAGGLITAQITYRAGE